MTNSLIDQFNRRLGESLGLVCGGSLPRFAWKWAPDQPFFVYDRDNRTLIRKTWADAPAPGGGTLGKVWVLAQWRQNKTNDNFGHNGAIRVAVAQDAGYTPHLETATSAIPTPELNQNYIWALDRQLQASVEHDTRSFDNYMGEERYSMERNRAVDKRDWLEHARTGYDGQIGAFGNTQPGQRGGYMSFENIEKTR